MFYNGFNKKIVLMFFIYCCALVFAGGQRKLKDMLYSNYNVLTLPIAAEGKYKIGDTYKAASNNWKEQKFNGLTIKNIDYMHGIRLHFDWNEWDMNVPSVGK